MMVYCCGCGETWEADELPFDHTVSEWGEDGEPYPVQCGPVVEYLPLTEHEKRERV